ncbi:MAG: rSAM/selenodomain-associated transferase 2 [Cellvibrionaceae bacterium]
MKFSIIIPVFNEAAGIGEQLEYLLSISDPDCEIIVIDGGSGDQTLIEVEKFPVTVVKSIRSGRAVQMNAGATVASGDALIFLHADTRLPPAAFARIREREFHWGFFAVNLSGKHWFFRVIEWAINARSSLTKVATGDQTLFVRRALFEDLGGFAEIPLMEDVELSKRLRSLFSPTVLPAKVLTSSRYWEQNGIVHTVILMWRLRFEYFCGVSPERLRRRYYR